MTTGVYISYRTSKKIQAKLGLLQPGIKKLIPKTTLWGFTIIVVSTLFCFLKRRKKHETGIRANKPNPLWLGEVRLLRTMDNQLHYIYFIIDNFLRCILNYMASHLLSGQICLENIRFEGDKFLSGG